MNESDCEVINQKSKNGSLTLGEVSKKGMFESRQSDCRPVSKRYTIITAGHKAFQDITAVLWYLLVNSFSELLLTSVNKESLPCLDQL